jgi:hypothetical protein
MLKRLTARLAPPALLAALALTGAPPAIAEYKTTTAQALAAHAEWLPYAPPPPNGAAAVCLVDTGVDLNPDTASNVIARIALDGGDPSDLSESKHGTQMAMVMGAPINDWGMVGFWPGVRIVSVRASNGSDPHVPFVSYTNALRICQEHMADHNVRVIELALSGSALPTDEERRDFANAVARARQQGLSVVASGGNGADETPAPANFAGVLSVGAGALGGGSCFQSRSSYDVLAPGCDLDQADPFSGKPTTGAAGSSQASALASSVLAALRAYRPDLAPSAAEDLLLGTAQPDSPTLNATTSFQAASLSSVIEEAVRKRADSAPVVLSRVTTARAARPRFRLARRGFVWEIRLRNRPAGMLAEVRLRSGDDRTLRVLRTSNVVTTVRLARTLAACVRYEPRNIDQDFSIRGQQQMRASRQVCRRGR